jgi:hypothetical protein
MTSWCSKLGNVVMRMPVMARLLISGLLGCVAVTD